MKIVLAGAFGHLGTDILRSLIREGYEVVALDLKEKDIPELKGKYTFHSIDIHPLFSLLRLPSRWTVPQKASLQSLISSVSSISYLPVEPKAPVPRSFHSSKVNSGIRTGMITSCPILSPALISYSFLLTLEMMA